jgi:hypothetical protein
MRRMRRGVNLGRRVGGVYKLQFSGGEFFFERFSREYIQACTDHNLREVAYYMYLDRCPLGGAGDGSDDIAWGHCNMGQT